MRVFAISAYFGVLGVVAQQGSIRHHHGHTFTRPRHLNALHAVLGTVRLQHLGGDGAVVLEEVQVAPGELGEVMGLAQLAAVLADKQS